jgi:Ca2+-binding RTX toxin-like protein
LELTAASISECGGTGNDSISGFNLADGATFDEIHGGSGNDSIWGYAGDDLLIGDAGDDRIEGGTGNDTLTGGADADKFTYTLKARSGTDTITDFGDGTDLINIRFANGHSYGDLVITSVNGGADTNIDFDDGTYSASITLAGVASSLIDASDFLFA